MYNMITLKDIELNRYASVTDMDCSGFDKRRFLDLGIIKGTQIRPIFRSPFGDPTAYEIRKGVIALREEDASRIKVL